MAGDIAQRAADYWPRMTRITCICSPCRAAEKRAKPSRRRTRSPCLSRFIAGANRGATRRPRVRRRSAAPRCARHRASFDRTRESIMAELRRELDDIRAGLCRLREVNARARKEREEISAGSSVQPPGEHFDFDAVGGCTRPGRGRMPRRERASDEPLAPPRRACCGIRGRLRPDPQLPVRGRQALRRRGPSVSWPRG